MSYLCCLCLFAHSGVQPILCCVCLRIVFTVLPVSLDCHFLIAPSMFSNVYLKGSMALLLELGTVTNYYDYVLIKQRQIDTHHSTQSSLLC
jgi:hypothetical protein